MYRFLHSSDLHLGKAFGTYPEAIRNRLREARHGAIARLAQAVAAHDALPLPPQVGRRVELPGRPGLSG